MSVTNAMNQALAFARQHVSECAAELVEMRETSVLPDGYMRQLGELCRPFASSGNHLTMAASLAERTALEHMANLITQPSHPNAGLGYFLVTGRDSGSNASRSEFRIADSAEAAAQTYRRSRAEAVEVSVINAHLVGVFDRDGKLEVGASLPEPAPLNEVLFDDYSLS